MTKPHFNDSDAGQSGGASEPLGPDAILEAKKRWLIPCLYHFYQRPPQLVSAEGVWVTDATGKRYLDCFSGVTVMNAGHANRKIVQAAFAQAMRLQHTTSIYLTEPMVRLAEALAEVAPGPLERSFFCVSGSEANEGALLLAALHTGRNEFLALDSSLHGRTKLAASATGIAMWRSDPFPLETIHFTQPPYCARCPWGKTHPGCDLECAAAIESKIKEVGADRLAGMIVEPIGGNGGIIAPPREYLSRLRALCTAYDMLLIVDEVQTGFGRTGAWFASNHSEVEPDIMTVAKALGNGFPISAFITREELAASYTKPGASTFGGNQMCCAAALATIEFHRENQLPARTEAAGQWLGEKLGALRTCLGVFDVRGRGLMWGIELADENGEPDAARCDQLLEQAKDDGFLLGKTGAGRNVLTLMPPLVIDEPELKSLVDWLDTALS